VVLDGVVVSSDPRQVYFPFTTETELFKMSYPGSTPAPPLVHHHHRLQP